MKEIVEEEFEKMDTCDENEHLIHMWEPLEFNINENYQYIVKNKLFNIFSNMLYYGVAVPVIYVLTKILYDLKIEGKENLCNLDNGAVSVSNHVLILDCAMVGLAWGDKRVYYTTLEDSFKIPIVRHLIKLLRAIPIPKENKNKPYFMKALDNTLKSGDIIHFYPEASLWPYHKNIRNFKTGAFHFAVRNDVPIIPMVFTFRKPLGLRSFFKRKEDVTLTILEPINASKDIKDYKQRITDLKLRVKKSMEDKVKNEGV